MCVFIVVAIFTMFLLFVPTSQNQSLFQCISALFVDMISPVSLRTEAYGNHFDILEFLRLLLVYIVGLVFFSGLLIATLSNAIRTRAEAFRNGLTYYSFRNHIVIIGFDHSVLFLIDQLLKEHTHSPILLAVEERVNNCREQIKGLVEKKYHNRIVTVKCSLDSKIDLEKLCIENADALYIFGNDRNENRDAQNVMAYQMIVEICKHKGRNRDLNCHLLLNDRQAFSLSCVGNYSELGEKPNYELITMTKEEMWCQKVLVDNCSQKHALTYPPLDREGIGVDSNNNVHLVVFGMSDMGYTMAIMAAHIAHYPNFLTAKKKTKITFVDADARKKMDEFKMKYRSLFDLSCVLYHQFSDGEETDRIEYLPSHDFLDIEWEFCQVPEYDSTYVDMLGGELNNESAEYLSLAVCYDSPKLCQDTAFYLPENFYRYNVPVYYRCDILYNYIKDLLKSDKFDNIFPFGMLDEAYISNDRLIRRAKKLNYLYENVSKKDFIMDEYEEHLAWIKLPVVKKWSNIYSAMSLATYLRSISGADSVIPENLSRAQIEMMAAVEHNRWNIEELLLGYRPTTPEEDLEILNDKTKKSWFKKWYIHCDIRPYLDLKNVSGETIYLYDSIKILNLRLLFNID